MTHLFDSKTLLRQRNRSAGKFFSATELPAQVEQELVERLDILTLEPSQVLVLGAVSAHTLETLCSRFSQAHFTVVDSAERMLSCLRDSIEESLAPRFTLKHVPGWVFDDERAPFDLVFSNFYLSFSDDLNEAFAQLHQVLRADGCFHFSCLGPDSFAELHAAWAKADPDDVHHTLIPPDMHDVGDALVHAGFREPVMDRENYTLTYSSSAALMGDLRNHGVSNGFAARRKGLTGRSLWDRFASALSTDDESGRLVLTLEVVIGQAWRGDGMSQQRRPDGAVGISLEALAHQLRSEQENED